jgi:hypothetical protein
MGQISFSDAEYALAKVRFRGGLAKNTAHVVTLFALSNLWMARKQLMAMAGVVRRQHEARGSGCNVPETLEAQALLRVDVV